MASQHRLGRRWRNHRVSNPVSSQFILFDLTLHCSGKRCPLKYTRAILDAIHSGELAKAEYETYDVFNLHVPKQCTNVPDELLNPKKSWTGSTDFKGEVTKLGELFNENFKKYSDEATEDVIKAGPQT
jgi:phosphoenolpyruvate carboxykinase (ATP)